MKNLKMNGWKKIKNQKSVIRLNGIEWLAENKKWINNKSVIRFHLNSHKPDKQTILILFGLPCDNVPTLHGQQMWRPHRCDRSVEYQCLARNWICLYGRVVHRGKAEDREPVYKTQYEQSVSVNVTSAQVWSYSSVQLSCS